MSQIEILIHDLKDWNKGGKNCLERTFKFSLESNFKRCAKSFLIVRGNLEEIVKAVRNCNKIPVMQKLQ